MEQLQDRQLTVTSYGVVVALLGVLVALFKDTFLKWWRSPILDIHAACEPPHCHKTHWGQHGPVFYLRLWVENTGRSAAESVEVFLRDMQCQASDGPFHLVPAFMPMNLRWSHATPPQVFYPRIAPWMGRHCDLGHIVNPAMRPQAGPGENIPDASQTETILSLDLEVQPHTLTHLLRAGVYEFNVYAAAANAKPVKARLQLRLTGQWYDDEHTMLTEGVRFGRVW